MSVVTSSELMEYVRDLISQTPTDAELKILEDFSDTLATFDAKMSETDESLEAELESLRTQLAENDAAWRKRYKDRFFSSEEAPEESFTEEGSPETELLTFADLFEDRFGASAEAPEEGGPETELLAFDNLFEEEEKHE